MGLQGRYLAPESATSAFNYQAPYRDAGMEQMATRLA